MQDALIWFLLLELTAAVALPWAFVLFRFLPDRGLTLAKPAALLLFSYALWVLSLAHIWPNTQLTVWAIFMVAFVGSVWLTRRRWEELREFLRNNWPVLLTAELIFTGLFALWAFVVSGAPSISHTEKPMDFMLLNAAHQARYFPAEDLWLSGHSISYYYFGHIIVAFLTSLSGVVSSTAYNLGVATIPALAGAVAFGLLFNLVRVAGGSFRWAVATGVAAPALVLLAGNLTGALEFVRLRGWAGEGFWDWVAIKGLDITAATGGVFPEDFWWWFRSTRVIDTLAADGSSMDYTITEFPAFSFVLGDLHAHVLAIPFLLLAICVALNVYLSPARLGWSWLARHPAQASGPCPVRRRTGLHQLLGLSNIPGHSGRGLAAQGLARLPRFAAPGCHCRAFGLRAAAGPVAGDVRALLSRRIQRADLGNTAIAGCCHPAVPSLHCAGVVHPALAGVPGSKAAAVAVAGSRRRARGGNRHGAGGCSSGRLGGYGFPVRFGYRRSRSRSR